MRDPRATIAKRELSTLRKEKTIVLALVLQVFIAAFSSFLVVGLVSLYDPGQTGEYGVDVAIAGDASEELVQAATDVSGVNPTVYSDESAAMRAFESPSKTGIDAVLVGESRDGRVFVSATVPDSNVQTTVVVVQLRDVLRSLERSERIERAESLETLPVQLPPETQSSPYYGFTYTVLVPLLLFLPVFISGSLTVDSLTEERERGTLELLRVAPVSLREIVDGKLLAATALAPAQAALWLVLLGFNGTRVASPVMLLVLVAALSTLVCSLAAATALLSPDRRSAQFLYSIGVLFVFGGTTLFPNNPVNTAARLAIGSADASAPFVVAAYAVGGIGIYVALRYLVGDVNANAL
ncbi:sodium ABC transporter permease [Halogeometricum borinquense DSM 11551]|uniref:ABC-type Na+ efflux pump, permease component n=2 Tax=Halogeometricum borinquense TaxID=60847 RepID=E4NMV6_HALBP|nr:ABC transporter permease [Halogeometricum borinquense]ADQ67368.1 ABC-type Na+ efflux pump, permease component [Halogeometricum borinquense DSM 11551]ELY28581.1 sodium ABC transporter permease [Halogeometricum borinquense DSM 11551]RYJ13628.1 ABC transporter permease [Halogeometricum borinquense]